MTKAGIVIETALRKSLKDMCSCLILYTTQTLGRRHVILLLQVRKMLPADPKMNLRADMQKSNLNYFKHDFEVQSCNPKTFS